MIRLIGQDNLANIAEYAIIPSVNDINALGLTDYTLVDRIKIYNPNFSYMQWLNDLEEKKKYINLIDVEYYNRVGQHQYNLSKPDKIADILSTPDTLSEYLNRLIKYNKSPYRKYYEMLTGDWKIITPDRSDETVKIKTEDFINLNDNLHLLLEETAVSLSHNLKAVGLYPHDVKDRSEIINFLNGIIDVVDIVYPIRK